MLVERAASIHLCSLWRPLCDTFWIIQDDPFWIKRFVVSAEQLRAGRGLLGWSQSELANRAGLSLPTVKRAEADGASRVSDDVRSKLRRALEQAGIVFIDENGGGPGVRLKQKLKRTRSK
jgi:DNA-binding XRE family transcriptional regulator